MGKKKKKFTSLSNLEATCIFSLQSMVSTLGKFLNVFKLVTLIKNTLDIYYIVIITYLSVLTRMVV